MLARLRARRPGDSRGPRDRRARADPRRRAAAGGAAGATAEPTEIAMAVPAGPGHRRRCASTRSARSRSTRSRRRTPAIPARRWRSRRSPTRSGTASCASIRTIRSGPTATASCCPPATPRCCSARCCTSPACKAVNPDYEMLGRARRHARRHPALPPARQPRARAIPSTTWVSGVETTTGPLGQGIATSVGMAIAQQWLARALQPPGLRALRLRRLRDLRRRLPDGGRPAEAASLAGHLELDNLCWIYDNNHITIEGNTRIAFTEDVAARFLGYGWNVPRVGDANDLERIEHALDGLPARPKAGRR